MIYIVEDDYDVFEIEAYALKTAGYEVIGYRTGTELMKGLKKRHPELIILDFMLEEESGIDILRELKKSKTNMNIPVIFITSKSMELEKVRALDAGADDYITKPFGIMELVSRVKAVLRRFNVSEKKKKVILSYDECITLDEDRREVRVDDKLCKLTYKEFELLKYLMHNNGIVLSRDKIMENVWGFDYQGETRTVDMHIKTLRQKLGEKGKSIKTIRNVGYKLD